MWHNSHLTPHHILLHGHRPCVAGMEVVGLERGEHRIGDFSKALRWVADAP